MMLRCGFRNETRIRGVASARSTRRSGTEIRSGVSAPIARPTVRTLAASHEADNRLQTVAEAALPQASAALRIEPKRKRQEQTSVYV